MTQAQFFLDISISTQQLSIIEKGCLIACYPVSTAKNGAGELKGSECTPRGWHNIRAKIGDKQPLQSVFKGRRPTGEVYSAALGQQYPQRDWILTRILWLAGLEPGKNRYKEVDTCWRYIYIHGCPDHLMTGIADSHGCIRMKNADMLDLFNRVTVRTQVFIHE
ncbi:L,D-transpeptidase [Crenothrix polyspora]|uniref:ErfK/YbiS/YcfS/YnhG family protein n=1 Tax=Crenothrix polyspora TaxID=360316 RepID=A0A1R4HG60_9GAMM|nr:L,D-transpeptidase [Crenothrix polyspora]SJM95238.1 ErfK/YbiS/YcfS/YnhG family protein [Crenothrix polyspora]